MKRLPLLPLLALVFAACGGKSCSCTQPIQGGFPIDSRRHDNALQVRLTKGAFDFLGEHGKELADALFPSGDVFNIPPSCGGKNEVCCINGQPAMMCRLKVLVQKMLFTPAPTQTVHFTVTTQLISQDQLPITFDASLLGKAKCNIWIDTTKSSTQYKEVELSSDLVFSVDATTHLTHIALANTNLAHLDGSMLTITSQPGDFICGIADISLIKSFILSQAKQQLTDQLAKDVDKALCMKCMAKDECDSFADACTNGLCMRQGSCLQEIGVQGKTDIGKALGKYSPSTHAGMDLLSVLGNYAEVTQNLGLSLGGIGGAQGDPHHACVPMRPAPAVPQVGKWSSLTGELEPISSKPYHIGLGLHESQLNTLAWAAFDGGGLCLNVGSPAVPALDSKTLGVLMPSLSDLTHSVESPVYLAIRPSQEPHLTLGAGSKEEPTLLVSLPKLSIDFYVFIEEHYLRVMQLTGDLNLPVQLDLDDKGQIVPMIGDLGKALTNVTVTHSELLTEAPTKLASTFPTLLGLATGQLGSAIKPIALPAVMGLQLQPVALGATDGKKMLSLYANFAIAPMAQQNASTWAEIEELEVPEREAFSTSERLDPERQPRVALALGGAPEGLEWSVSFNQGLTWTPYSSAPHQTVTDPTLWLPGHHALLVRARRIGAPETTDPAPQELHFEIAPRPGLSAPLAAGCTLGHRAGSGAPLLFLVGLALIVARRHGRIALLLLVAGCNHNEAPVLTKPDLLDPLDEVGRHVDAVAQKGILYLSAYDGSLGDLAYTEIDEAALTQPIAWQWVDGVPEGVATGDYRRGILEPGDDVGLYTSLGVTGGNPRIAYYDATHRRLKFATGSARQFTTSVVDEDPKGGDIGRYASLVLDAKGVPSVAYVATNLSVAGGRFKSELRLATAQSSAPAAPGDWNIKILDTVDIPCAGLCATGQACLVDDPKDPLKKSACKPVDAKPCSPTCAMGEVCIAATCKPALPTAKAPELVEGVGLFAQLRLLSTGLRTVVYYQHQEGDLKAAVETAPGIFTLVTVDGMDPTSDLGQFASARVAPDDTVHIAYHDAIHDRLLYRTLHGTAPGKMAETIDDGARSSEIHLVGAGAALWTDGTSVQVAYQDATAIQAVIASRGSGGWTHTVRAPPDPGHGFYPHIVADGAKRFWIEFVYRRSTEKFGELLVSAL